MVADKLEHNATPHHDATLVTTVLVHEPRAWIVSALITAAVLIGVLMTVALGLPSVPDAVTLSTGEATNRQLATYLRSKNANLVLVGSSLFNRLTPAYFASPGVYNLALAGESPVTGLSLLAMTPHTPRIVVIEANIMDRATNEELLARFSYAKSAAVQPALTIFETRPLRVAARYIGDRADALSHLVKYATRRQVFLAREPENRNIDASIEKIREGWDKRSFHEPTRKNIREALRLIGELEGRHARVFLVFQPYASELMDHPYAKGTQEIWREETSTRSDFWLDADVPSDQLRFDDGVHLDRRSVVLYVDALERAISQKAPHLLLRGQ